jgi:hypothetical protein
MGCSFMLSLKFDEFGEAVICRLRSGVCCPTENAGQRATIIKKKDGRSFPASMPQVNRWNLVASNMGQNGTGDGALKYRRAGEPKCDRINYVIGKV